MKKTLSIIIPTYNVELFLERCLDSLTYNEDIIKDLDVIIVNDGSTDNSAKIAKKYCKKYPKSFRLINKENGGHGSTINVGVKEAQGKYIKILDSDDWFNIIDFPKLVSKLKTETADVAITNYRQEMVPRNEEIKFVFDSQGYNEKISFDEAQKLLENDDFFYEFSLASMAIKKEVLLKGWGDGLFEKTFYVDQQFVAKALAQIKSYIVYDLDIYRYFIGRLDQSVNTEGFLKHRHDHIKVLQWLLNTLEQEQDNTIYQVLLTKQILAMLKTHYNIYIHHPKLNHQLKKELLEFDNFIKSNYPDIHKQSPEAQKVRRRLSPLFRNRLAYLASTAYRSDQRNKVC